MYNPYQQQQQQGMGYNPQQQQPPPQQQQGGFGYNSYQQPQYTQPQMFPQATGFIPQQPNLYGSNFQTTGGLATQATGFQQPQPTLQPQQTGYIQTQPTGFGGAAPVVTENSELKIPSMRLSFITAEDQKKFEHLFRTAVPKGEQSISGDSASGILLRSGLLPVTLAEIWSLSDINNTGSLLFPEFALSLHLCSMAKRGEPLPGILPDRWLNEVKSFMDQINFSIPDDPAKILANTPFASFAPKKDDWLAPQGTGFNQGPPPMTSFQPQATGFGGLVSQPTGGMPVPATSFGAAPLTAQRTGGGTLIPLQPQQTAGLIPAQKTGPLQQQRTGGLVQQTTGYNAQPPMLQQQRTGGLPQQATGYGAPPQLQQQRTGGLPQQTTGYQQLQSQATGGFVPTTSFQQPQLTAQRTGPMLQSQPTGPLQAQPTGRPGEWGFVSMPTGGIPGLNAMQQHFLPNTQLPTSNLHSAMDTSLKSNVTWAITKQEKQIYDGLFQAWDSQRRGYVDSTVALNVFTKSGLSRPDLESIWTLVDTDDTGKLNKNQFAVAMHLIYRRLNGYDIPLRLPPELVPPADRTLRDTMDSLKNSLKGGANHNKPAKPAKPQTKPDGTRFKNNDDSFGYVSNARHKRRTTDLQDSGSKSSLKTSSDSDLTIDDMKKLIHEKKILLDAMDTEDQANNYSRLSAGSHDQQLIERLKKQIMDTQTKIDEQGAGGASAEEKKQLSKKLDHLTRDVVPKLISDIHKVNQEIAKKKVELVKLQLQKENPSWNPEDDESQIVGTGPNGEVTDYDRIKFQSRKKLKQRMAALTGKSSGGDSDLDFKLKDASEKAQAEANSQSEMIKDIGAGIKAMEDESASKLNVSVTQEAGSDKWEKGIGISAEVAKFVKELQAFSAQQSRNIAESKASEQHKQEELAKQKADLTAQASSPSPASKSSYTTPEERAAYIKEQAEKRMNERLAKLGITRRGKSASTESVPKVETKKETVAPAKPESPKKPEPTLEVTKPNAPEPAPQNVEAPKPEPVQAPPAVNNTKAEESSDDDDDEEYRAILKQKQEMEAREKERKLRKQKAKEERLAKIRREMEEMKQREQQESEDEEQDEPVTKVPVYKPQAETKSTEEPKKDEITTPAAAAEEPKSAPQPHDSNPFAKMNNSGQPQAVAATPTGNNPFFKSTSQEAKIDPTKAAAQRASQRGVATSSGWSDSEDEDSDDDGPNRAGAAQLASLLFGGMSQPPARSDSNLDQQKEAATEQPKPEPVSAEPKQEDALAPPSSSSSGEFETPEPEARRAAYNDAAPPPPIPSDIPPTPQDAPPIPDQAPPIPSQGPPEAFAPQHTPPLPEQAPPVPSEAPPLPDQAPPIPGSVPPPPPPPFPVPSEDSGSAAPPPPPPFPFPGQSGAPGAPPPPPPPPAPPAPAFNDSGASAGGPPAGGPPNINALLGQITGGKSLKKVETKVSSGATVGRVL
ncbi:Actin cytoskeleton-regulatory complex protein PAN1 [Candida viswanathii]|uniref:Actin cytoskeleton-regulatory complex protein PAN1 n=1 Tax=Candida viswanathii TaxID=5486 RepID=A0A367XM40_9ASCO|nr:Actin cytoskeleton-regulatory complex protein PAN1 [Candida viswanathii]